MAEKIFSNVRLGLKVDTLENWSKSTLPLKKGEVAFATVAASAGTGLTEPVVMMKIGEDGIKTFKDIEWNFYAKAADVLAACKSEDALKAFINGVITDAGVATDEALSTLSGRVDTLEGTVGDAENGLVKDVADNAAAILALEGLVGDTKVATQISTAIAELDLANTYEAKGEAAKVSTALETYKTANDAAVQKNAADIAGEISRAKAAEEANATAIATIKDGTTIDSFADVEAALAGKQGAGDYSTVGHKHEIADVNGLSDALADAAKAGTDAAATAESNAKAYTDAEIAEWVGDKTVGVQISEAIANYTTTADMNAAIGTAKGEAIEHANGLNTAMNTRVEALEAIDHSHTNADELDKIADGDVAKWNAAEQNAKDYADGLNTAMDGRVADLEALFEDGEGSVADQIADAVAAEAALREAADAELQAQIGTASAEGKEASGLHARIEGLEGLVGDKKVSEAISDAVKVETDRAEAAESGLAGRIKAIEDDYLTAADEKALQDQITTNANAIELLTNGVSADEVDGVNDLIQYVKEHGTEVTGIKADIKANADAIAAIPQADWAQEDETAADYIKNKPFYTSVGEVEVAPMTTVHIDSNTGYVENPFKITLTPGVTYTVIFDDVTYYSVAKETYDGEPFIGNSSILGWNDNVNTEEPFFVDVYEDTVTVAATTEGDHTISILTLGEVVHKLDAKYIPDEVRSDWNQNDPTAIDYIENRPFYDDEGVVIFEDVVVVDESHYYEPSNAYDTGYVYNATESYIEGQVYTVTINNAVYRIAARNNYYMLIGDASFNEYPFYTYEHRSNPQQIMFSFPNAGTYSVKISYGGQGVRQLDEKFIPNTIARVSDVDAIAELVGDTKVSEAIAGATNPLVERIVELEKVDHSHENASVLDGIEAANITAWDAKVDDVTAAADSGLKATRTGNTVAIEIDDTVTFIFDCGDAGVTAE